MSVIGLRVGPFEVREPIRVPERGDWYLAVRTGSGRQRPNEVLVQLLPGDASPADRAALQAEFDTLRALEGLRVPTPVAFYDGLGALAVAAPRTVPVSALIEERRADRVQLSPATLIDLALDLAETLQSAHHRGKFRGHSRPTRSASRPTATCGCSDTASAARFTATGGVLSRWDLATGKWQQATGVSTPESSQTNAVAARGPDELVVGVYAAKNRTYGGGKLRSVSPTRWLTGS
jgi:hypothetical protein